MKTAWIFIPFLCIGSILLLGAGYFLLETRSFLNAAAGADGTILENRRTPNRNRGSYYPRVRFRTAGGQELTFTSNFGSRPPSYHPGDRVHVLYDSYNPKSARIDSFAPLWLLPMVCGIVGIVFASVGGIPLAWMRHVRLRDRWLMANGQRVLANFDRVELNTSLRVNGKSPYRIVCQWQDPADSRVHVFRSHNLWLNPQGYIKGTSMIVMVDPANLNRYVVDVSFLPQTTD